MKNSRFWLPPTILLLVVAMIGCDEKRILITPTGGGGGPTEPASRKVLVEELTGVRCPNCPEGTATLVSLGNVYGKELVVVSIHAAPGYDQPYPESQYDFRTPDGTAMANFIGDASFFPCASVNRRIVPPETEPYLPRTAWAGLIDEERAEDPLVGLKVTPVYAPTTRKLDISVDLTPLAFIDDELRLTVLITQDSIVDYQKVNLDKVSNYVHRHVFRDALTQPTGDIVAEPLNIGATITKTYSLIIPASWVPEHCSVVAFAHYGVTPNKEVLQVEEEYIAQ